MLETDRPHSGTTKTDRSNSKGVWAVNMLAPGIYTVTITSGSETQTVAMTVVSRQTVLAVTVLS